MHLAEIDVEEQAAARFQQFPRPNEPGLQGSEVVAVYIGERFRPERDGAVSFALESPAIPVFIADRFHRSTGLHLPRVERRIDVDEIDGGSGEASEDVEVVAVIDREIRHPRAIVLFHPGGRQLSPPRIADFRSGTIGLQARPDPGRPGSRCRRQGARVVDCLMTKGRGDASPLGTFIEWFTHHSTLSTGNISVSTWEGIALFHA